MPLKRCVLEMGVGFDLHGGDVTKAAYRAVHDAIHRNSLNVRAMGAAGPEAMHVHVLIGVPDPGQVRGEEVLAALPYGQKTIEVVQGGLAIPSERGDDRTIMANAAVVVSLDLPD
ncbi:MAG TPA: Lin0512 family protein [Dehalococcoidia bacterium]|nr:Lin0512 family protein [Dehalococcoidia bacterium]